MSGSENGNNVIRKVGRQEGGGDIELTRPQRRLVPHVERARREIALDKGDVNVVGDGGRVEKGRRRSRRTCLLSNRRAEVIIARS